MQIYVVKENDTVDRIGADFGISPYALAWANQIEPPYRLAVGQALFLPDGAPEQGKREITLGGYAYPWIEQGILEETASYLTDISVFSYGFTAEGALIFPEEEGERRILEAASVQQVEPVLVLTPLDEEGHFNNDLVSALVRNLEVQQRLIRELWAVVQEKGYRAVNVDFEYVLAEDREGFAEFVRRMRVILNLYGIAVTVALAPKTSDDQPGLLYEGIDYSALGEAANGVFLMTYEWGYTYSEPMAVAPLPYVKGITRAQSIGYTDAIRLAVDHGVPIFFDEVSRTPWFRYWQYGIQHELWFEDVRSYQAKFGLMEELGLPGAGFWQLMRLFRAGWLLADSMYKIRKLKGKY